MEGAWDTTAYKKGLTDKKNKIRRGSAVGDLSERRIETCELEQAELEKGAVVPCAVESGEHHVEGYGGFGHGERDTGDEMEKRKHKGQK